MLVPGILLPLEIPVHLFVDISHDLEIIDVVLLNAIEIVLIHVVEGGFVLARRPLQPIEVLGLSYLSSLVPDDSLSLIKVARVLHLVVLRLLKLLADLLPEMVGQLLGILKKLVALKEPTIIDIIIRIESICPILVSNGLKLIIAPNQDVVVVLAIL